MMTPYDSPDYHALIHHIRHLDRTGQDSTLARLVTADWLEERGEVEHAELIRVDLQPDTDAASEKVLIGRQFRLTDSVSRRLFPGPDDAVKSRGWADGFVGKVECPLDWWLAHGPDLCRRHPVREVVVTDAEGHTGVRAGDYPATGYFVVWDRVPGFRPRSVYHTQELATSELNAAALLWAESEADRQHTA